MNSNRKIAIIVGVLFITATVTALLSLRFLGSILDLQGILHEADYLIDVSANENQVIIGVLLELILAASVIGIAVMMVPILKNHNETIALGYVGARIIEAVVVIVGAISYLSLLTLSQEYVKAVAPDASYFQTLGTSLLAVHDWTFLLHHAPFGLAALPFYYLLYQSKLIPRFISVWGLIGAILLLAAFLFAMFGYSAGMIVVLVIAVNEMFLAVWLIVKGFNSSAIASGSAKTDINERK